MWVQHGDSGRLWDNHPQDQSGSDHLSDPDTVTFRLTDRDTQSHTVSVSNYNFDDDSDSLGYSEPVSFDQPDGFTELVAHSERHGLVDSDGNPDSVTDIQSDSQSYCELDYHLDSDRFCHPVSDILGNTNRKPEPFDQPDGFTEPVAHSERHGLVDSDGNPDSVTDIQSDSLGYSEPVSIDQSDGFTDQHMPHSSSRRRTSEWFGYR